MKILTNLLLASAMAVSLSGCIVIGGDHDFDDDSWESRQESNREMISQLELNTDREYVVKKLGAPSFSEAFTKGDNKYRVLFYRTQHLHSDGDTTKDETTPLVFKNEKLIGWGDSTLAEARS